jgi:hypothetical protein
VGNAALFDAYYSTPMFAGGVLGDVTGDNFFRSSDSQIIFVQASNNNFKEDLTAECENVGESFDRCFRVAQM